ncbi:Phytosulfokine receptor 1 [Dichanthelium oligosanthes]|uniref:Phytosulfokine receptor 1 n=1 Tax=Dichanthelium oligosanthes TaxID=888268 RepID=A0A1E5V457_9POAL|nr:Phytosulfokine receptor 1 [Dichanthelium oligosanthes]
MANNSLHGTLGLNFSLLRRLRALHLDWNHLSGHLPASLSRCRELRVVNLRRNNLSGPVPSAFRRLQALSFFDIGNNSITSIAQAFRTLQECRALTVLILTINFQGVEMPAVGQIPPWLGGFDSLYRIDLSNNVLTGEIPLSLTRLKSLDGNARCVQVSMSLYGVRLHNWHIDRGQLWYNHYIPPTLDLSRNGLTGAIRPELGDLRALSILNLSWNALSGTIPATLASLSALQTLDLS